MESAGEGAKRIYGEGSCEELLSRRWAGFMESAGEGLHSSCTRDSRGIPQEFGRNSAGIRQEFRRKVPPTPQDWSDKPSWASPLMKYMEST